MACFFMVCSNYKYLRTQLWKYFNKFINNSSNQRDRIILIESKDLIEIYHDDQKQNGNDDHNLLNRSDKPNHSSYFLQQKWNIKYKIL